MRPAHIEPLTGEEQTVAEHNKQVAALAQSFAAAAGLGTTAWLAGRLHDLGKDCDAFEAYLRAGVAGDRLVRRGDVPHAPAGMRLVLEQATASTTAARIAAEQIASAIAWHHGLGDFLTEDGKPLLAEKLLREKENNDANYQQALLALESQDFPPEALPAALVEAAAESEQLMNQILAFDKQNRYFYLSLAQRFLLSALIDADRIDTAAFFSHSPSLPPPLPDWALLADEMEQRLASLPRRSALDGKRAEISGLCLDFAKNEPGVYRLPVPTGGGKTYASFRFALAHAAAHQMQHIIYVAPYLSIIEQSADNLRRITGHPEYFLEHHSNLVPENADEYRFLTSGWQPPIIITTAVQLLNTLFSPKTGAIRRMHALAKSVIIFDEIQSLPPKCTHLFNLAMNFLAQFCGATIILCSATQPRLEESGRPLQIGRASCRERV